MREIEFGSISDSYIYELKKYHFSLETIIDWLQVGEVLPNHLTLLRHWDTPNNTKSIFADQCPKQGACATLSSNVNWMLDWYFKFLGT